METARVSTKMMPHGHEYSVIKVQEEAVSPAEAGSPNAGMISSLRLRFDGQLSAAPRLEISKVWKDENWGSKKRFE